MGFFDSLFDPIENLEPNLGRQVERYTELFNQILDQTDTALKAFDLPIPECLRGFEYEASPYKNIEDEFNLKLRFPQFRIPPSVSLLIRPELYCVWSGTEESLRETMQYLDGNRPYSYLYRMIRKFSKRGIKFGWMTQSPYDFYKQFNHKEILIRFDRDRMDRISRDLDNTLRSKIFVPLNPIKAIHDVTPEKINEYEPKLRTFLFLTKDYLYDHLSYKYPNYSGKIQAGAQLLPDWVADTLPSAKLGRKQSEENDWKLPQTYRFVKVIPDGQIKSVLMRQFFENLDGLRKAFIFSLTAAGGGISFDLGFSPEDAALVEQQLMLHFPDFTVSEFSLEEPIRPPNWLEWHPAKAYQTIKTMSDFHLDPYRQIFETLTGILDHSAEARIEIWCKPFPNHAGKAFLDYMQEISFTHLGRTIGVNLPEESVAKIRRGFQNKLPGWLVNVRLLMFGSDEAVEFAVNRLVQAFKQYETHEQQWVPANPDEGNLISLDELVSLAHFPTGELNCDLLEVAAMKQKLPPALYATGETVIGVSEARGKSQTVFLPEEVRDRHVYLVGKSGTGKSTLLEAVARADIEAGFGAAIIDPHGDTIRHLMESMPAHRLPDCIYFNPVKSPVSLEILSAHTEVEIDLLTDDLVTMFRRTSESWGDKMQAILQMTFQTLLRVPGSSFTDITRLLTDKQYRAQILTTINHPQLAAFWEHRYDARQAEPILIRMDRLTTSSALYGVLTQHANSLNFYDVIKGNKIFLADLSKGTLGESTSHLLGSIIVSQIQLAAMRQAQFPTAQRVPFSLFVDEVQNFTTGAFSTILSEARKYKLRLTLAHQFVSQLPQDIQKAVFGNVGTLVFFAMSPDDLGAARHELGTYDSGDVANLPKYHALCRPATAARDTFSLATLPPAGVNPEEAEEKVFRVISGTQEQFRPPIKRPEPVIVQTPPVVEAAPEKLDPVVAPEPFAVPEVVVEEPTITAPPIIYERVTDEQSPVNQAEALPELVPSSAIPFKNDAEKGNSQHRYLQLLVKRIAESHGFQAAVEKEVFGGVGRVDVALEKETERIAVEISVTNEADYEVQNIQKCLAAGFETVAMISADTRHLEKIGRRAKETLAAEELAKIQFFSPEEFHSWLENLSSESSSSKEKVKGFKVNVKLKPVDTNDQSVRKKAITDVVLGGLKNLKKDDSSK